MRIFDRIIELTASINLGERYPLFVSISSLLFSVSLTFLTAFVGKIKRKDKTLPLVASLISYFSCGFKIFCDFFTGKPVDLKITCISIFISVISLCFYFITLVLSRDKDDASFQKHHVKSHYSPSKDGGNQLIDGLLRKSGEDFGDFLIKDDGQNYCEKLTTRKLSHPIVSNDYGINYSQILYFIDDLLKKDLTAMEKEDLNKLKCDAVRFSHVYVDEKEREEFSNRLTSLFKLMSKYA